MANRNELPKLVEGETRIIDLETAMSGTLDAELAVQLTVNRDDNTFQWYMKNDYMVTWDVEVPDNGN